MERSEEDILKLLSDPFPESDIEWRVQQSGMAQKPWAMIIPYIDNRAVEQRLDDLFGIFGWEDAYKPTPDGRGMLCGITLHFNGKSVTKWDGAEIPRKLTEQEINKGKKQTIDPIKTSLSNSEKRAAVKFGIGRYLYKLDVAWALCKVIDSQRDCSENATYMKIKSKNSSAVVHAEWVPPSLESWALPSVKSDALIQKIYDADDLIVMKGAYRTAYKYASSFSRSDLIKKAVEAKDEMRLKFDAESEKESSNSERAIRVWLERTVTDQVFGAQNESVLKLAKKNISNQLKEKCLNSGVDIIELMQVLEKYYQEQLNKLNAGA